MAEIFNGEEVDLSALYRDSAAPKDPDPSEVLFGQLGQALKGNPTLSSGATVPERKPSGGEFSRGGLQVVPGKPAPQTGTAGAGPSADSNALLARLKPLGITNLGQLRSKSDSELRKLSTDVVTYELRQQSLAKYFKQKPDGTWDFTIGPDGQPTGLDATGKVVPPGGATKPGTTQPPVAAKPPAAGPAPAGKVVSPVRPPGTTTTTTRVIRPPA